MREHDGHWEIILARQAEKQLHRLPLLVLQRIDQVLLSLSQDPYPLESRPLPGQNNLYRLQIDRWRLTYTVEVERLVVLILEIVPGQQPERYVVEEAGENQEDVEVKPIAWLEELVSAETAPRIRVLIVAHQPETRANLRKLLYFASNLEIMTMTSAEAEVIKIIGAQPDVIVMDLDMPGLDGLALTEKICQQMPSAKVIIMSVHGEAETLRRAMLAGAKEFLIKPFSGDELANSIQRVFEPKKNDTLADARP